MKKKLMFAEIQPFLIRAIPWYAPKPYEGERVVEYVDKLEVNLNYGTRQIIRESEIEGISDMQKLVDSSKIEHSWVYLPKKKEWHDVVKNHLRAKNGLRGTLIDREYVTLLMGENDEIVSWHFHPYILFDADITFPSGLAGEEKEKRKKEFQEDFNSMPSGGDLSTLINESVRFFRMNPAGRMSSKICLKNGIASYSLTRKGFEFYSKELDGSNGARSSCIDCADFYKIQFKKNEEIMAGVVG